MHRYKEIAQVVSGKLWRGLHVNIDTEETKKVRRVLSTMKRMEWYWISKCIQSKLVQ